MKYWPIDSKAPEDDSVETLFFFKSLRFSFQIHPLIQHRHTQSPSVYFAACQEVASCAKTAYKISGTLIRKQFCGQTNQYYP